MKTLIDANVILRYLLKDHAEMSQKAMEVINNGAFTLPEVMAEVVYVLQGVYHIPRDEIGTVLIGFLSEIDIQNKGTLCEALNIFANSKLDFVDCILIARHRCLNDDVFSFDKKLNKLLQS